MVVFSLMPENAANAVAQLGGFDASQEPAVDGAGVGVVFGVGLVLIDPCAAHGSVEDTDWHFVTLDQVACQIDAPRADLTESIARCSPQACANGPAPTPARRAIVGISVAANPIALVRRGLRRRAVVGPGGLGV